MLSRRIVAALAVASLLSPTTSARTSPYFACTGDSYDVLPNESDEITLHDCSASTTDEILRRLRRSALRERPVRLNRMVWPERDDLTQNGDELAATVVHLDLSEVGLCELDVRRAQRLQRLNLTSNRFRSLAAIRLRDNATLVSVDVSHNRVSALAGDAIPSAARLLLRSNGLSRLETNLTLPEALLELELTRNRIESVSAVRFASSRLTLLDLSGNLIDGVSAETFARLPALRTLLLRCNKIVELEADTFAGNARLVRLDLRDNEIRALNERLFDPLLDLRALDVSKNRLLRLTPDNVRRLTNLAQLSVSENARLCGRDPAQRRCERDLQFLLAFGPRLRVLRARGLGVRAFPLVLTTFVRTLDLSANELSAVRTGDLENFPSLRTLDLSGNVLATADKDVFGRMEYLRELLLHDNRLQRVPGSLPPSLSVLRLDGNRIRALAGHDLRNLAALSTLRLDSNSIASIEGDAFAALTNLRTLDISGNPIQRLRMDTFEGANSRLSAFYAANLAAVRAVDATRPRYFPASELPSLRYLNLSGSAELARCFLRDYPLLATVKQLEVLDLDNTNLTRTPSRLRNSLPRLRLLSLRGNAINCSRDSSFVDDEWREAYRSETSPPPPPPSRHDVDADAETELTVRVTRRRSIRPLCYRLAIRSACTRPAFYANCSVIPREDFWSRIVVAPQSSPVARKLGFSRRSPVTAASVEKATTTFTTILLATTQRTTSTAADQLPMAETPFTLPLRSAAAAAAAAAENFTNDARSSFFDWFPSLNDSTSTAAKDRANITDASAQSGDCEGSASTHPGLFIFFFVVCTLVSAAFGSLIAPMVRVRKRVHTWRPQRQYDAASHADQRDLLPDTPHISSISTCIDGHVATADER